MTFYPAGWTLPAICNACNKASNPHPLPDADMHHKLKGWTLKPSGWTCDRCQ